MSAAIPVFRDKFARGWPEHAEGDPAHYMPPSRAMTEAHASDAHFATYSVPEVKRRLATEHVFGELDSGIPIVLFVVDVEPDRHARVTPEWWGIELEKLKRLLATHPGGYVYRTRGGYRIVYALGSAFVLGCSADAERWKATYLAWLDYVKQHYGIVGDRSCQDWTRLYRLPRVVRDGEPQEYETLGDPAALGTWSVAVELPEPQPVAPRKTSGTYRPKNGEFSIHDFMSAHYPGVQSRAVLGGERWDIECPWKHEHSTESRRETSVFAFSSGAHDFKCLHNHCADRHWKEFRRFHEPDWVPFDERAPAPTRLDGRDVPPPRDVDSDETEQRSTYKPVAQLAVDVAREDIPAIRSYSTGNLQFDNLTGGGINTRELCVVMGPPGGCKTAWAISMAVDLQRRVPVLYASTELEQHELKSRVVANVARKSWAGIRRGVMPRSEQIEILDGLNILLLGSNLLPRDGEAALKLVEREAAWIAKQQKQAPVVFLDYLQELARGADRDVKSRVGDHASTLRAMSQRLDGAVIAISSVSRTYYSAKKAQEFREADDPTVYLAAAKESGDVDYAAARVIFLDAEDDREKPERNVRIAVAKSRDGRTGFAGARVLSECGRFESSPEVVTQMAAPARALAVAADGLSEVDEAIFQRVVREHAKGNREACTARQLRDGNRLGKSPIGKDRAVNALERLVRAGRLKLVPIERKEGDKLKTREIYEPAGQA